IVIEVDEPEAEAPPVVESGSEDDSGSDTGEVTDPVVPVKPPEVTVVFIAGRLKWAEIRVAGQRKGVAEPTRTVTVPVGTHRVQYRQNSGWKDVGTIVLEPGKSYEAKLSRSGIKLSERI
ncbi:MAG: hypothetical protein KC431_31770, partial [Myxococcales bacterium]|nr:hypothetical protein [Myxococcales bacterium]